MNNINFIEEEYLPEEYEDPEEYNTNKNIIYRRNLINYINTGKLNDKIIINENFLSKSDRYTTGVSINVSLLYLTLFEDENKVEKDVSIVDIIRRKLPYNQIDQIREYSDYHFISEYYEFIKLLLNMCELMMKNRK
jgi:hypothetical protein